MNLFSSAHRDAGRWDEHFHQRKQLAFVGELHALRPHSSHPIEFQASLAAAAAADRSLESDGYKKQFKGILDSPRGNNNTSFEHASGIAKSREYVGEGRRTASGWGDLMIAHVSDRGGPLPKGPGGSSKTGWGDLGTMICAGNKKSQWGNTK